MKSAVHLLSGGLDSVVMLYDLHSQDVSLRPLLFDYKQRHVQELQWAKHHCLRLGIIYTTIELPQLLASSITDGKASSPVVPNRNAIMLSIAVNFAVSLGFHTVTYACNEDDAEMFPDCRPEFLAAFNSMIKAAGCKVEVKAPYIDKPKWWIAGMGRELAVALNETWSCYVGGVEPCGRCLACRKRAAALSRGLAHDVLDGAI